MMCRLCSRLTEKAYHFFDADGLKMEIVGIVAKHFWFEPKPEDNSSHLICDSCWTTTKNFHELYLLVEKIDKTWGDSLFTIKEDPCNSLVDYDENCYDNVDGNKKIYKSDNIHQNIRNDNSILKDEIISYHGNKVKNGDSELDQIDMINECISSKEENLKTLTRRRGRPPKSKSKNEKFKRKLKQMQDDEYNSNEDSSDENKEKKQKGKRSIEETAAFNKKVEEGDALIAKFMKINCNVCCEEQKNFTTLRHHCTSIHGQQGVVICCGRKFYRKTKLVEHIEVHLDPEKHKCHICNHISANRWNLKLHMDSLHKEHIKSFKCSFCGKAFRLQTVLTSHELTHMPEEDRKFKCLQCEKNFPAEQMLKSHIRVVHDGQYSGVCDICGKAYNNRGELKRHRLEIHEGVELKFQCNYCGKEFKSKYTCNVHKFREHENTNPDIKHKCPMCDKTSKTLNAIKNHIRYVHKAKPKFECTLCNKFFKRELSLKEHTATHTGQSLYSCPHCPRTFTHSSNMHHHRKLKHPLEFEIGRKVKEDKKESWTKFTSIDMLIS